MKKEEIIKIAEDMDFKLDYDKSDKNKEYPGDSNKFRYIRFISKDELLDEKDLRWIWWMDESDRYNIENGKCVQSRLKKKKEIQNFLKY